MVSRIRFKGIVVLLVPFLSISCFGGKYVQENERSLGEITFQDRSKAKKTPLMEIKRDQGKIQVLLRTKTRTPEYKAEKVETIQEEGERSAAGAVLIAAPLLPFLLAANPKGMVKAVFGEKTKETKLGEKLIDEKPTGNIKENIAVLSNHLLSVTVNGVTKHEYKSDTDGIVRIPIKTLVRKQTTLPQNLQIDLLAKIEGESAQQSILLSKEDLQGISLDSITWDRGNHATIPGTWALSKSNGFALVQDIVKERVAARLVEYRQLPRELRDPLSRLKEEQPIPPKLEKGQFESTANFQKRVDQAKTNYEQKVNAYNEEVQELERRMKAHQEATREIPAGIRDQIIEEAFLGVFGRPKAVNPRYDADTETFFVDIISDSRYAGGFKRTLSLSETIPNAKARDFYNGLMNGEAVVELKLNSGQIVWDKAAVIVKGKAFAANPNDADFKPVNMQSQIAAAQVMLPVDLKDYALDARTAADRVQVILKEDPEIARLQREIYERKREKIIDEQKRKEIARLEDELKRLQTHDDGSEAPFGSVDLEQNIPVTGVLNKRGVAVVIGNRNYNNTHKVSYARRDAETVKEYLTKTFGYDPTNIIFLLDATLANMVNAFGSEGSAKRSKLSSYLRADSEVFIYYSGHGAPGLQDKKSYLVPIDADINNIEATGYSLDTLYKNIDSLNLSKVTVVIDACFSGNSNAGMIFENASPALVVVKDRKPNRGAVITSSSADQISSWYPEKKHSLFTYFFLALIKERVSQKRPVTSDDLKGYVSERVDSTARRLYNRIQTPSFEGNLNEAFLVFR